MPETTAGRNERVADYIADIDKVSLHTAAPNASGSSEVTGGSPAYARVTPAFTAPASGATDLSAPLTFNIPAATTPSHYGLWKGATFLGYEALSTVETFTGQGQYILTSIPISA